ncbi:MAG: flippase [Methanobacteriaceae archaeon]|nr:flippase [Methanobacteriaceae archaeon]
MTFLKHTFSLFFTQISATILITIISIVNARYLGPSGLGIMSLVVVVLTLLSMFGNLGIGLSNIYFGGKNKYSWEELTTNSLLSSLILGSVLITVGIIYFLYFSENLIPQTGAELLIIISFIVPFMLLINYLQSILLGQYRIKEYNITTILQNLMYLAFIFINFLIINGGVRGVIISYAAAVLLTSLLLIFRVKTLKSLTFKLKIFTDTIKFGVKGYIGTVIQFFNYRIDMLILNMLLGAASVGYYTIAVSLVEALWYFPNAIGTLLLSRTPKLKTEDVNRSTPLISRNAFFITLVLGVTLFIFGKYIILMLFGNKYLPSVEPLWYLIPGIVALSICKVLGNELAGRGKPIINTYISITSLVVNVPLNFILIPVLGISGSALASTVSYTVSALLTLVYFSHVSDNKILDLIIIKKSDLELYKGLFTSFMGKIKR